MNRELLSSLKTQPSPYVEVKTVTWCKDSHGLFDYESKNVTTTKTKVETSSRLFREGTEVNIKPVTKFRTISNEAISKDPNYLCSIATDREKTDNIFIQLDKNPTQDDNENSKLFLVVRSLKNEEGVQQGYDLEIGDVIRVGRIEYRVIEYQNHKSEVYSMLSDSALLGGAFPFKIEVKDCNEKSDIKKQCRICLMDEDDTPEVLVNPCNCKGTSQHVHIQCLQDWITSKMKKKVNPETTAFYWKKLNCEVCKVSLPDLVEIQGTKKELLPIYRPEGPYILLERVFYDRSKENADNSKTLILLTINDDNQIIKLGRGHECDLRENDISVSRMHAFIKYENEVFSVVDNNSKFGTLVLLRKSMRVEKNKKLALQFGRTVTTFSLKQNPMTILSNLRSPMFMEKLQRWQSPKPNLNPQIKTTVVGNNRTKNIIATARARVDTQSNSNLNGSFLD